MDCIRCHDEILPGEEYVTLNRHVERQDQPGECTVLHAELLKAHHLACTRASYLPQRLLAVVLFFACELVAVTTTDLIIRIAFAVAAVALPIAVEARTQAAKRAGR